MLPDRVTSLLGHAWFHTAFYAHLHQDGLVWGGLATLVAGAMACAYKVGANRGERAGKALKQLVFAKGIGVGVKMSDLRWEEGPDGMCVPLRDPKAVLRSVEQEAPNLFADVRS